jgi:glycine/D-amino acid oxidase-like deaminating enzyme/nitrite reductase/ring-hydroxylating ferredoxin subunit
MDTKKTSNHIATSGKNIPYWIDSAKPLYFSKLSRNIKTDAVIIGGGISGLTTAYFLLKSGKKIVALEDGFIGSGETGRTTAHIANALDDRYHEIESIFSKEKSKLAAESHTIAIDTIESIVKNEEIDCDFERVNGILFIHPSDNHNNLEKEFQALQRAGIPVSSVNEIDGIKNVTGPFIRFPNQAQFHPVKYLGGIAEAIKRMGGEIFTQTHVDAVEKNSVTTSDNYFVEADHIVVATNTPVSDKFVIHTKQAPYRTYVIAARILKGSLPKNLWWDTGDHNSVWQSYPYHYIRVHNYNDDFDLLISGGEDHKTGQAEKENIPEEERYFKLYNWTKKHFPVIEDVVYHWSGQVMEPVDNLAFIGKNPMDYDNIYIISGDSGNGITHGTIAGIIINDLILGRKNKFADLYDPSRITIKSTDVFLKEQLNVAKQYLDFFTEGTVKEISEIKAGNGAILKSGGKNLAAYRDEDGTYQIFSAVCPHLKCIITWNDDEKSFDCPCHGSRFSCYGKVINGPANKDLEKLQVPVEKMPAN